MLSRPRNPPLKTLLPSASSLFSHQVKLTSSFWKMRSRNSRSRAAVDAVDADRSHHVHRRIDVVEVPLVRGQRAVRMLEPLAQQHEELVLRERRVEMRPRDRVEPEIPRREPRVLPRIRHREHVEGVEVAPVAVAAVLASLGRRQLARITVEPAAHVVRVDLLAPDETGAGLAQDLHLLRRRPGGRERAVELVGVGLACGDRRVERTARPVACRRLRVGRPVQPQPQLGRAAGRHASGDSGAPPWCRTRPG